MAAPPLIIYAILMDYYIVRPDRRRDEGLTAALHYLADPAVLIIDAGTRARIKDVARLHELAVTGRPN